MLSRFRPRSVYDVLAAVGFFIALSTGGAYAANTVFSEDIVDGEVKRPDIAEGAVVTGKLADGAIIADKLADGAVTSVKVRDQDLTGKDVRDNSLKGADIDEATLSGVGGGGGAPSGPAGGDLTGTYPDPQIAPGAVGKDELAEDAVGESELKTLFQSLAFIEIQPGSTNSTTAKCPFGYVVVGGGAAFEFPSGELSQSSPVGEGWRAEGQNGGHAPQFLSVRALCLG